MLHLQLCLQLLDGAVADVATHEDAGMWRTQCLIKVTHVVTFPLFQASAYHKDWGMLLTGGLDASFTKRHYVRLRTVTERSIS